jgi:hypothetical protein
MNSEPNRTDAISPAQGEEWDPAMLEQAAATARGYYELGMLDEAEAAMDLPQEAPAHWRSRMESGLARIKWARGDLEAFVQICYPWRYSRTLSSSWYIMVSSALMNLGRVPEAMDLIRQGMELNVANAGGFYNLACFHTKAGQYALALEALSEQPVWSIGDQYKALVDSDLQPLWYRLPELMAGILSPCPQVQAFLNGLAQCPMQLPAEAVWDHPDRQKLPVAFCQWLIYSAKLGQLVMNPQAPGKVKRQFKQWTMDRARAAQRLVRRAVLSMRESQGRDQDGTP